MPSVTGLLSRLSPKPANKGFSEALAAYRSGEYAAAITDLLPLAKNGHAESQALLAHMYREGEGVVKDLEGSARWTRLAAEQGDTEAQFNLGVMYQDGIGVSPDISEALRWYRLAAQFGFSNAQINLANCFHKGAGVDQDEFLAAWWISLAAEQGDAAAQLNLGARFLDGIGVSRDLVKAFFWFDLAAKTGSADAVGYRESVAQMLSPDQMTHAQALSQDSTWKSKPATDSAFEVFEAAAHEIIESIRRTLGDEQFKELKVTKRKIPSAGELILGETHGIRPATIAENIKNLLAELERRIDLGLSTTQGAERDLTLPNLKASLTMTFIRRLDDLADVGTFLGDRASKLTHTALEFHLSLIGALEGKLDEASMRILMKRFALKDALRAPGLNRFSGLQLTMLPFPPW